MLTINPQYITDTKGKKISAILKMNEFNTIIEQLEELEDIKLYDTSKRDNKPAIPREIAMKVLEAERKKLGK